MLHLDLKLENILLAESDEAVLCDIFSYGVVLWCLISQKKPFQNYAPLQILFLIKQGQRERIPDDVSKAIKALINQCWKTRPELRPNASSLVKDIQTIYAAEVGNNAISLPCARPKF